MMKKLKFRIWDEVAKEFHYWGFLSSEDSVLFFRSPVCSIFIIDKALELSEQFTGLTNQFITTGHYDIYKGDIVNMIISHGEDGVDEYYGEVIWDETNCGWSIKDIESGEIISQLAIHDNVTIEIHGNIHENPELMERGE